MPRVVGSFHSSAHAATANGSMRMRSAATASPMVVVPNRRGLVQECAPASDGGSPWSCCPCRRHGVRFRFRSARARGRRCRSGYQSVRCFSDRWGDGSAPIDATDDTVSDGNPTDTNADTGFVDAAPIDDDELTARKIHDHQTVNVAYLGGSITAQAGWRVYSFEWIRSTS